MSASSVGSAHGRVAVGHPIDVASGEFLAVDIDHELGGVVPLSLGRTFNTRFLKKPVLDALGTDTRSWRPFGPGWRPTWFAELRLVMDGFLYTRADGAEFSIQDPRGETSFANTGRIHSAADGLEIQRITDTEVRVVGYGRERNEHSLVFELFTDKHYRLMAIERTREARVDIVYDMSGRPSHLVQRRERRSYELVYEGARVVRVDLRLPDRTVLRAAQYGYDGRGRLVSVEDSRGMAVLYEYDDEDRIVRDEKRGGSVYTIRYAPNGRCAYACGTNGYEERSLRYDLDAKTTYVTDSHGGVTVYEWNDRGQVMKTTTPCGVVTRAQFDELGRPVSQTSENGILREQVYDELGRVAIERVSDGPETSFYYDEWHRPVRREEAVAGSVTSRAHRTYDESHNVTTVNVGNQPSWKYTWSVFGELVSVTDPSGATTQREYDELGALRRFTDADRSTWMWTRDALGRVLSETDPLGQVSRIEYLDEDGQSLRLTQADGRVFERLSSTDERIIVERLPGNRSRTVELSFCGQPIEIRDEEGATTRISWGTEPSELGSITNANGVSYLFAYDSDLRLVERRTFDGRVLRTVWDGARIASTFDGSGRETKYEYGPRGLVAKQTSADGETVYTHDNRGLLEQVATATSTLRLWRDDDGRIIAEDQDGIRIDRTFDVIGRPTSEKTPFGPACTFDWSLTNACSAVGYGDTSIAFERDGLGRETRRQLGGAGVFEQSYDPAGRLVGQAFRASDATGASSDSRVAGVIRHFGFDERGFLASIEDSLRGATRLIHSDRGDLTGVVRKDGWSNFYAYDPCQNRVLDAKTEHGAALAAALDRAARERDASGEPVLEVLAAAVPHLETSFGYSRGDRVLTVARADGRTELTYDTVGQVIAKAVVRGAERATWRYAWNARGELVAVTTPNGLVWTYGYDPAGRRITKRSPTGDTWRYVWMGTDLRHTLKNGKLVETYIHEPGGTCPLARDDGALRFILPDQNDAPSEEISADGRVEWIARRGAWGEGFSAIGATAGEPALGQWYDHESGLHYNLFRYYDPDIGRFISPDPIELAGGTNLYLTFIDPYTFCDQFGLSSCPPGKKRGPKTDPNAPHNKKIRETAEALAAEGNTIIAGGGVKPEIVVDTPGGNKNSRRPDIIYETPTGEQRGVNVGLTMADGVTPVPRERAAMADLSGPGSLPMDPFVPYGIRGKP